MITTTHFGKIDNKDVYVYKLDNNNGLSAEILNYGGIIKNLCYKNTDVVLGRDTLEQYLDNDGYFGALVGRNSNRIANAKFTLNGVEYVLAKNNGNNNLHGGNVGFNAKIWNATAVDEDEPKLILSYTSPDGEEGFPGTLEAKVTYTITKDNEISIHYEATCDKDTIVNMTNHSYFNLNGHKSGTIDNHTIALNTDFFTPNNPECYPTGEILSVDNTAFDLRAGKTLNNAFTSDDKQIALFGGFDHNMILSGTGYRYCGTLEGDKTGIKMELWTDQPAVQLYSGNGINEKTVCKENTVYKKHQGVCLETQIFPNATEYTHFPSPILRAGEKYDTTTAYKFI